MIESIASSVSYALQIDNVIDNLDGTFDLEMCDISHLQPGFTVTIGGNSYVIDSFIAGGLKITGSNPIVVTSFVAYPPYFFHGTVLEANKDLTNIIDASSKTPMIYFYEVISETFYEDNDNAIERESDIRLFFLTQANFANWNTNDYHENAIQPMRRLMERFIRVLKDYPTIDEIVSYTVINQNKFGVFIADKGYEKSLFNDNLSGVELRINLAIRKEVNCVCD